MRSHLAGVFLTLLAITMPACNSAMTTPDIKLNPHPKMRYEITLTIDDAPGPFESVLGYMQFEVTDRQCSPEDPVSGTWNPPFKDVPVVLNRADKHVYTGAVYLDLLQDEDYYGLGKCHWRMTFVTIDLKGESPTFSPSLAANKIASQQFETTYFAKEHYFDPAAKGMSFGGVPLSDWITKQPEKFFSTTLTARESSQ
jgi:hypothetical protein